jgi:hypothetical protein
MCGIDSFEFWKLINSYAQFDPMMPIPVKRHLRMLEVKILSQMAWAEDSTICEVLREWIAN